MNVLRFSSTSSWRPIGAAARCGQVIRSQVLQPGPMGVAASVAISAAPSIANAEAIAAGAPAMSKLTFTVNGEALPVQGVSWMDHEFGSSQLSKNQVGWDWFAVQLDDSTELMLYRMRRSDGAVDRARPGVGEPQPRQAALPRRRLVPLARRG